MLVDYRRNLMLTDPDPSRVLTPITDRNAAMMASRQGSRGTLEGIGERGEPILAAFAPVPGLPWSVVQHQPSDVALAPLQRMTERAITMTLLAAALAAALSAAAALVLLRPLERLRHAAEAIAGGDLSRRGLSLGRRDEIGDLGRTFDRMAEALRAMLAQRDEAARQAGHLAARREALLRAGRRVASEPDTASALQGLLTEATRVLRADGGLIRRLDPGGSLVPVAGTTPDFDRLPVRREGEGVSGQVLQARRPLTSHGADVAKLSPGWLRQVDAFAVVAAPLLHEGRALGTISIFTRDTTRRFSDDDAETLELLAGIASAALMGMERSRLDGVLLAARTAEHELNNRLALAVGYAELLAADPRLPEELREIAREAQRGAFEASRVVDQMARTTRLAERTWGPDLAPTLDLERSTT